MSDESTSKPPPNAAGEDTSLPEAEIPVQTESTEETVAMQEQTLDESTEEAETAGQKITKSQNQLSFNQNQIKKS